MANNQFKGDKIKRRKAGGVWSTDFRVPGYRGRVRKTTETRDKTAAEIIANNLYNEMIQQTLSGKVQRDVYTLEEAISRYTEQHLSESSCTVDSLESIGYALNKVLKMLGKDTRLHEITNNKLTNMVHKLKKSGLAGASINRHWQYLRAVMRKAERSWGAKVPVYPDLIHWSDLKQKENPHRMRFLTQPEAHKLLNACAAHIKGPVMLALLTGMRRNNCTALDWSEVDFEKRTITVTQKGGERFVKPINLSIRDFLREQGPQASGPVFTYKGKPLGSIRKAFQNAVERAGITDFTFHDLRHTYATWLRQAGADLAIIQQALGHKSITTTMIYANVGNDEQALAAEAVAQKLANLESQIGHTPPVPMLQAAE